MGKLVHIKIELTNGQKYTLRNPDTLGDIDSSRTALFVFNNGECYHGCSDGQVDEDGDFAIFKPGLKYGVGLPFNRLVGWQYERKVV